MSFTVGPRAWTIELNVDGRVGSDLDRWRALEVAVGDALHDARDTAALAAGIGSAVAPLGLDASVEVLDLRARTTTLRISERTSD
jgi:hypothetical protein